MPFGKPEDLISAKSRFHNGLKHGAKRSLGERERDLVDIAKMHLENKPLHEINAFINSNRPYTLSINQIRLDVKAIHQRWRDSYLADFDELKSKELARIDKLEMAYWEAWETSKKKKTIDELERIEEAIEKEGKKIGSVSARTKMKKREEMRDGAAVYLEGIRWCIEERARIYGFHAPSTVNVNWRDEALRAGIDPDKAKDELVEQFVRAALGGSNDSGGLG